ncbi:hypothetical protein E2562_039057 [Oryza meyeriana var. granulata]|uniref:Uncharacterized protein n=1 Tax=Oryza meyeriana var. granulata TaxID=110450 RepID=A0A6G1EUI5_9ORYZ|nr:hypothetical protein E2562_039057 [Oryza meyeriana var. granulata]
MSHFGSGFRVGMAGRASTANCKTRKNACVRPCTGADVLLQVGGARSGDTDTTEKQGPWPRERNNAS